MNQIPGVVRLNHIGKGGHRRASHTGDEDFVNIPVSVAAFKTRIIFAQREVVRTNRLVLAVSQCCGGWTVAFAVRTMTLPAFELGEECLTVGNALQGNRRLGRNLDGRASLLSIPARRIYLGGVD